MPKINLLDKNVSELIAAGEVIEKPASVIKELVENAIDAGAKSITVEIKNGGISYMRVTDDGCGIAHEEVPTAFLRHATSKVRSSGDLDHIVTMGFRGEALASICAVARVELLTKQADSEFGTSYKIYGGEEEAYEHAGCPDGTTIIIRDLFYNTPARLKFLKKDVTEGNSVQGVADKLALAHPEVSFRFIRDNKPVRVTTGDGKYYSAIYSVFGKSFAVSLIPVDFSQRGMSVSGYVSSPLFSRGNRSMQYFFVNGRAVKSLFCMTALEEAFRNSIMVGKFPACVLNIEMSPDEVDVNVSPSKTEVRFVNDKAVFDTVYFAVKNAVLNADNNRKAELNVPKHPSDGTTAALTKTAEISPEKRDASLNIQRPQQPFAQPQKPVVSSGFISAEDAAREHSALRLNAPAIEYAYRKPPEGIQQRIADAPQKSETIKPVKLDAELPFEDGEPEVRDSFRYIGTRDLTERAALMRDDGKAFAERENEPVITEKEPEQRLRFIGELYNTYILCECGKDLVLIDKHAAHERIRFEKMQKDFVQNSQLLAQEVEVTLSQEQYNALDGFKDSLADIGIEIILKDNFTVEVTAMPTMLDTQSPERCIATIADIVRNGNSNAKGELFDDILHSVACKGSIKAHDYTSAAELEALANRIWSDETIRFCPHGRPIVTTISKYEIEKMFGRS